MIRLVLNQIINGQERKLGASLEYMRYVAKHSLGAFLAMGKFVRFAQYRKAAPLDAWLIAHLVAAMDEDCGACVQIGVNLCRQARLPDEILAAVLERKPERLPEDLRNVYEFASRVAACTYDEGPYRDALRVRYGDAALIELSYSVAAGRVYPAVKRGLGYATECGDPRTFLK